MAEPPDLLFFDTFSHESSEELNLDLVQFPKPVYVSEIRIIPLGARVQGDFPGGVRLGATNPTQFQIDFFVNDLSKPGASTFETLGSLEYCQNGRIHMDCEGSGENARQIPTDGLVLRGWYTTITLAVYGTITKNLAEQISSASGSVVEAAPPPVPVVTPPPPAANSQPWAEVAPPAEVYSGPNYPQDTYDPPNYPPEYYGQDVPKDPRAYLHVDGTNNVWNNREDKDMPRDIIRDHSRDKDRINRGSIGHEGIRLRSRSPDRDRSRERNSPRYSRSRSRERDYPIVRPRDDNFPRNNSRSPGYRDRERSLSRDKDWERPYKRDDYRPHRQPSYERSRAGSYEKKRGSSPYEKRPPSYERRPSYEKRGSSYEKHVPYDKRYEKRMYDKRPPSYDRMRSHSPNREDPRKRPRTPPIELPRRPHTPVEVGAGLDQANVSPVNSVTSDNGTNDFDHKHPQIKEEPYCKNFKPRKIKADPDKVNKDDSYDIPHPVVIKTEIQTSPIQKINTPLTSPVPAQEENASADTEQFEPILSDEDICDDMENSFHMDMDYEITDYCGVDDVLKCFNPFRADWQQFVSQNKPNLYLSNDVKGLMSLTVKELCAQSGNFSKLYEMYCDFKKMEDKYIQNFSQMTTIIKEDWIDNCEKLPPLLTAISAESDILYRIFKMTDVKCESNDIFMGMGGFLVNFCRIGLDYDFALSQNVATNKIRHIKCGIRLLESLASHKHNEIVIMTLLNSNMNIYMRLFELYSKDFMALSIKLMILKALDACLGSEATIEYFLMKRFVDIFEDKHKDDEKDESLNKLVLKNGYQVLLSILNKNPPSRVKFAINSLLNKVNLYELLLEFHESVLRLNHKDKCGEIFTEAEIEFIINSLGEILSVCQSGSYEMTQPQGFKLVSAQADASKNSVNSVLIEFFHVHKFIETCLYLLTCPLTYNYPVITNPIYEILSHLVGTSEGILYLSENIKVCDLLFQTLMQPFTHQSEEVQMIALQDYSGCTSLQQLGFEMAHKLQALYYVNCIFNLQSEANESELFDKLHGLYCLGFGSVGKLALANILSMGDNILCLLNLYEKDIHTKSSDKEDNVAQKTKSPIKNYAVDLTVSTIQYSDNVNFLKKYGRKILNVAKKFDTFEQSIASILQEVLPYLKPLEKPNIFLNDNITELVEILKVSIEHVTAAPGDLITCLRVLKHLGIPEFHYKNPLNEAAKADFTELKYKYVIIQLFSLDGVPLLVSVLEKLCSYFEQPSLHTATFVSVHGLHIVNIVLPTLELLNKMLTYVIQCRNTQFKDLTAVPVILQTYNLMYSYPVAAVGYKMAQKACRECIEILLAYTQPIAEDSAENESIHKSLWTLLANEVIKYTIIGPYTFIPGLLIFSEILPLPLPIQTKYTLSDNELSNMVSNRKLWSAHLHTLCGNLTEMIQTICISVCQPLLQLLKRVCVQLADLASNMALCVSRAILDLLISNVCGDSNVLPQPLNPLTFNIARILNFLACLATHPSIKCTIFHLIRHGNSGPKSDDRYSLFVPIVCSILMTVSDSPQHIQCQEYIVSIISSFYDSEITMLTQMDFVTTVKSENQEDGHEVIKTTMTSDIYLANAVPSKEVLVPLISASLEYAANENSLQGITVSILRTFFLLTEHDYGFYYFKLCLDKNKTVFPQLFTRLVNSINKESPECLSIFLELLRLLQTSADEMDGTEGIQFVPRTHAFNLHDISELIGWDKSKEHLLCTLEKMLKDLNAEEELMAHVRHLLSTLVAYSNSNVSEPLTVNLPPALGVPENLVTQFNGRCLWTQGDAQDERLVSNYWFGMVPPPNDDDATDVEMVPCDLAELTRTFLPAGTDLVAEAERLLHLPPAAPRPPTEPAMFRTKRLHVARDKRPYISPARGRGIPQQSGIVSNVGNNNARIQVDAFRSRPPNTSRPPSLHVDDFLALEGCGVQPTGPTGYNKLPVMNARGGRGMRTRGGITVTDRGRFASSTPTNSTIYRRGGRGWQSATPTSNIVTDGSQTLSTHYSRSSAPQHFQTPIMSHGTSLYSSSSGWSGLNRGNRRGRGVRNSRATFLR